MTKKITDNQISDDHIDPVKNDESSSIQINEALSKPSIKSAIEQGSQMISEGKTKADAARHIFSMIKEESKEIVVAAFVKGASLTDKGALTYWYNCRRRPTK